MTLRILVADDHPVVRDGLRFAIERADRELHVVGEAGDGLAVLDLAATLSVDVFVLDVTMPVLNGIETTRELLRRDPAAKVIMLSLHDSFAIVDEALRAGARGYLTKTSATRHVVEAIHEVHAGRCYLSPDAAHHVVAKCVGAGRQAEPRRVTSSLTRQERRILQLLAEGHTSKAIASQLGLSPTTVHKHRSNLMAKLDIHEQVALVRYALREGIAKP